MRFLYFGPLLVLIGAFACATQTTILSNPSGATVYEDGEAIGQTPLEYQSEDWIWQQRELEIKKRGYAAETVFLERDQLNMTVTLVAGVGLLMTLWPLSAAIFMAGGFDYPEEYVVELARPGEKHTHKARKQKDFYTSY